MVLRNTTLSDRSDLIGIGLAMFGAVAFGTLAIFAKHAYEAGAQAVPLLAARFGITTLLLVGYQVVRRARLFPRRDKVVRLLALGAFGYGVEATLFFLALERAPASVVGLVFYSYPLWTTLIAIALRIERFEARLGVALLLGTIGVASIFSFAATALAGPLFALAAAAMVALFYIGAQLFTEGTPPATSATWTAAGAAGALITLSVLQQTALPREAWLPAAGLGVATAIAFIATYAAVARIGSSRTSVANMMELVTTFILATILLGEEMTVRLVIGALLVLSAIPVLATKTKDPLPAADAA